MYTHTNLSDTIVALATPPGIGAIGVVRLSGTQAIDICNRVFVGKNLQKQASHTLHFGTICLPSGAVLDEVLVSLFRNPRSYTGEDTVEVSCHGSPYILQRLIELFISQGARLAQPGEFTLRAFLHGKMDLSQAEAVAELIASQSESAHQLAIQQMRGGFSSQMAVLRQQLINFASLVELELDFSEEDVAFADRQQLVALVHQIRAVISALLDSFALGNVLKNGVTTVIVGKPNAGKSTLLNALLNEDRAIVSHIAGTTRDTIEEILNIDGIQFRLVDTAGIRQASDTIEAIGVEKTMQRIRQSAIVVYLFDVNSNTPQMLLNDLQQLHLQNIAYLLVGNKIDEATTDYATLFNEFAEHILFVSAKEQLHLEQLKQRLKTMVLSNAIEPDSVIVSNARHYQALQLANQALADVLKGIDTNITTELLALDIRAALHHLGTITGEVTNDDLLGNIFANFCIGK